MADYVCLSKNIIVEFSGKEDEKIRKAYFNEEGFNVLYVTNEEVEKNVEEVISKINNAIQFSTEIPKTTKENISSKQTAYEISVFTTRPDTIFGVSFMTLAPEHELVSKITTDAQKTEVENYIRATAKRSERDRMADVKTISGVFTGAYAEHPLTKKPVPVWVGDYVLAGYGTGAVMSVPCGDQRDYDFAKHFNIEIPNIFKGIDISEEAYTESIVILTFRSYILQRYILSQQRAHA